LQFDNPHGIGVAADGAVLVCDTGSNRVLRIDLKTGRVSTLIEMDQPRGLDVAADSTLYVVDAGTKRIAHLNADGSRLGFVGPIFNDPYDVEVAEDGVVYVLETAEVGTIRAIAPDGTVSTISTAAPSR
jgi:DNA-binding beta-propeller fold protein YncE